jgi:hypothetical protein
MASVYLHKTAQGDETGGVLEWSLKPNIRQSSVERDFHGAVHCIGKGVTTSHTRETAVASDKPIHLTEHSYSCFIYGQGKEGSENSLHTMDKLEIQSGLTGTIERYDRRADQNGCCVFFEPERNYISGLHKKATSLYQQISTKFSNLELQCRAGCQSDGSENVPVASLSHLHDHSYCQTDSVSNGGDIVMGKDQEESGVGTVTSSTTIITCSVPTLPKQRTKEVAPDNVSERRLNSNCVAKMRSTAKGTIYRDTCVTGLSPLVVTHSPLPSHLVDHSYQQINVTSVVDKVIKGADSDFETADQGGIVSSTSTPAKTIQMCGETSDVCSRNSATDGYSREKTQCSRDQPKPSTKKETVTVTLTFSRFVLGEPSKRQQICWNNDVSDKVYWSVPIDHSYTGFCSSAVPCDSTMFEDGEKFDKLSHDHDMEISSQRIGKAYDCSNPPKKLQTGCTETNVGIPHGNNRKRPRKMVAPHQYAPRTITMESRLPTGTVDCLIFNYNPFNRFDSRPRPRQSTQMRSQWRKMNCEQLRHINKVKSSDHDHTYTAPLREKVKAPQMRKEEKSVQALDKVTCCSLL